MTNYPLYDKLVEMINEESDEDDLIDITTICKTINSLASLDRNDAFEHYIEIYALILHYDYIHNNNILLSIVPNNGKVLPGNKGVKFNTLFKTPKLRQIISKYIKYYSE